MRLPIILVLASSSAFADPGAKRVVEYGLEPSAVPVACRTVLVGDPLAAKISVANCMAILNLKAAYVADTASSYASLADAAAPSLTMLQEVIDAGNPERALEALHAKADLLNGLVVRMRNTAPPIRWNTVGAPLELAQERHDAIEVATFDWRNEAENANRELLDLAVAHPESLNNPIVAAEVRTASQAAIATR